jgi:hypothetical protein
MLLLARCALLVAHESRWCRVCSRPLACRLLSVARCLLHALHGFAVFCAVSAACRMLPCCLLSMAFSKFDVACCMLHAARCMLMLHVALLPCCLLSMVFSEFHVARCMLHVALHVVVGRCMLLEAWRMLPVVRCMSFVACCTLPACCLEVVCRMPPVACCRVAQRRHTRSAARRRSPFSASVTGEACCSADRGVRACVCVCVHACVWVARVTVSLRVVRA